MSATTSAWIAKRGFSEADAAAYLGISERTLRQLVVDATIPVRYRGRTKLYDVRDLDAFFDSLPTERSGS